MASARCQREWNIRVWLSLILKTRRRFPEDENPKLMREKSEGEVKEDKRKRAVS